MRYLLVILAVACGGKAGRPERPTGAEDKQLTCSGADLSVSTSAQCESGAACYQLADGSWCAGPRWFSPTFGW